jgi:hypothetical protein
MAGERMTRDQLAMEAREDLSPILGLVQQREADRLAITALLAMLGESLPDAIDEVQRVRSAISERYAEIDRGCTEAATIRRLAFFLDRGLRDLRQLNQRPSGTAATV